MQRYDLIAMFAECTSCRAPPNTVLCIAAVCTVAERLDWCTNVVLGNLYGTSRHNQDRRKTVVDISLLIYLFICVCISDLWKEEIKNFKLIWKWMTLSLYSMHSLPVPFFLVLRKQLVFFSSSFEKELYISVFFVILHQNRSFFFNML